METAEETAEDYLPKASKLRQLRAMIDLQDWQALQRDNRESTRRYRNKTVFGDDSVESAKEPDMGDILIADNITIGGAASPNMGSTTAQVPAAQAAPVTQPPQSRPAQEKSGLPSWAKTALKTAAVAAAAGGAGAGITSLMTRGTEPEAPPSAAKVGADTDTQYQLRLTKPE